MKLQIAQQKLDRIIAEIEGITEATILDCAVSSWEKQDVEVKESKPDKWFDLAKSICVDPYRTPYPWCPGHPTKEDCIRRGYCAKDPNCGE